MHKCTCVLVCIVFLLLHHTGAHKLKHYLLALLCRMQKKSFWRKLTKSLLTLPHLVHTSFHVVLLCVACLHQLCCFHVVLIVFMLCCCVFFCVQSKPKVALPEGSVSKKYKMCFTCTCCFPGTELAKDGKVYKSYTSSD